MRSLICLLAIYSLSIFCLHVFTSVGLNKWIIASAFVALSITIYSTLNLKKSNN